jgi:predicted permease
MTRPNPHRQFLVLFRSFLSRMIDLELLASRGEIETLLAQFAAMLAAFSFTLAIFLAPRYATSPLPHARLLTLAWLDEEFLIGTTMAIAGLFTLLAWNTVLPDRRDSLVLGPLPVRIRTLCQAKAAALLTSLGVSVLAVNAFTGLAYGMVAASQPGLFGLLRCMAAYWLTMAAAGLFVCCALLALQGVAAQIFSYRLFQRVSSFLQLALFFVILAVYFLKPPLATVAGLTSPHNQRWLAWLPTYWFLGLFQQLNGPLHPVFAPLAARALWGLLAAAIVATVTYVLAYQRGLRRIVEQPDIATADRSRPPSRLVTALAARFLKKPLDRAIVLFTARSIARSRQHRLILAAYGGIALAVALAYLKSYLYGTMLPWEDRDVPLLAPSVVLLVFAVIGARAVFALPIALPANWIFRITAVHSPNAYFSAVRKALAAVAATPVLLACAAAYCFLWPGRKGIEHIVILTILGIILVERSLYRFRKIPFACSYLPGKANLRVKLGAYGILFLFLCNVGVQIEAASLRRAASFTTLALVLLAAAAWSWFRTVRMAASPDARVQFDEVPVADIFALDLNGESGVWSGETYVDATAPREPVSLATVLEQSLGDFRAAIRALAKSLPFTAAAIVLIAVGIGANTAIYSMIHAVLTKPAPGIQANRLVSIAQVIRGEASPEFSYPEYLDYALNTQTLRSLAAYGGVRFTVTAPDGSAPGSPYELRGQRVTANFFDTLGVHLAKGRTFTPDEASGATGLAAVIAWHVWQNQFHGAADIIGRTILVSGLPATIVGVTAQGFRGPQFVPNFEIGVPIAADSRLRGTDRRLFDRAFHYVAIIGQLAPRATVRQVQAKFDVMSKYVQSQPATPDGKFVPIQVAPYSSTAFSVWQSARAHFFGRIITAIGLLTLLIVCANVANLMLARSVARQREMAVRRSLGASNLRILRLLMSEGLVLALAASAAALLFASWAVRAIVKLIPPLASGARIEPDLTPDTQVALYALALAVLSALAFTIAPALRAWRQELLPWLRSGENSVAPGRSTLSRFLVVAQLALCVLLLTGAGLASRSVYLIGQLDLHFAKDHLLLAGIDTAGAATAQGNIALLERLRQRLRAVPGIVSVSYATAVPSSNFGGWSDSVQAVGAAQSVRANGMYAGPGYLETLGVRGMEGRGIAVEDVIAARKSAVINRNLAQALWPNQSALGRELLVFNQAVTVVGVAPNTQSQLGTNYVFLPDRAGVTGSRVVYLRYAGSLDAVSPAVRQAIREVDTRIPVVSLRTMERELEEDNGPSILIASLLGVSSTAALILAAIGLYAVVALQTARRRRDFGIRMALGASSHQILATVLREGLLLAAIGGLCGLALSVAAGQALRSLLIGISPTDPITYCGVIALLTTVSLLACFIPANRATQTDPSEALRQD